MYKTIILFVELKKIRQAVDGSRPPHQSIIFFKYGWEMGWDKIFLLRSVLTWRRWSLFRWYFRYLINRNERSDAKSEPLYDRPSKTTSPRKQKCYVEQWSNPSRFSATAVNLNGGNPTWLGRDRCRTDCLTCFPRHGLKTLVLNISALNRKRYFIRSFVISQW